MKGKSLLFFILLLAVSSCKDMSEKNYKIAYNVLVNSENDDYDIFIMNIDGTEKKNITNHSDVAWSYYAFGNNIYFISDRDTCKRCYFLYEMDFNGNNIRKISDIQLRDSWLSSRINGSEFIINPHPKIDSLFYIIDKNGNTLSKINTGLAYSNDPIFSNNGKKSFLEVQQKNRKGKMGLLMRYIQ